MKKFLGIKRPTEEEGQTPITRLDDVHDLVDGFPTCECGWVSKSVLCPVSKRDPLEKGLCYAGEEGRVDEGLAA